MFSRRVRGGKSKTVEPGVNIPFIASCPGTVPAGVVSQALLDFTDIVPTCVEFAGQPVPGRSMASCLVGGAARSSRRWILAMGGRNEAQVSDRGVENRAYFRDRVVRDEHYKLYIGLDRRPQKLVDLTLDPDEKTDLTGAETEEALSARQRLESLPTRRWPGTRAKWCQPHSTGATELAPRWVSGHPAAVRGNAAGKLVLGADGIQHYNYYWSHRREDFRYMEGAGNLDQLRGQEKQYALGTPGYRVRYPPFDRVEPLPVDLEPGERRLFRLPMCSEPEDAGLRLVVHITIPDAGNADVGVSVNGSWPCFGGATTDRLLFPNGPLTRVAPGQQAVVHELPAGLVRDGWNEITLYHPGGPEPAIRVLGLELGMCRT